MASNHNSDVPLVTLDTAIEYVAWDHLTTSTAPDTPSLLSPVLSVDNNSSGGFKSSLPATYSPGIYTQGTLRVSSLTAAHSRYVTNPGPSAMSVYSSPLSFSVTPPVVPSSTTVLHSELDFSVLACHRVGTSLYSLHTHSAPFPCQIYPPGNYGMDSSNSAALVGFFPESSASAWGGTMSRAEPATAGSQNQQVPGLASNQHQRGTQPRRQPRHLTTKEEANFQCAVRGCGKLFSRSYNHKAHMETHAEKREYPFPCLVPDCDKKFVRKTDLQRHHQGVHMKEKNHKCDYCGRLFSRKDTLSRHMDDGCSKRFDLRTLNMCAGGTGGAGSGSQGQAW